MKKALQKAQAARTTVLLLFIFLLFGSCRGDRLVRPDVPDIETKIRSLLSLPTVEHKYRDLVYLDSEKSFLIFRTSMKQLLFSIDIDVQAGIDLSRGISVLPGPEGSASVTVTLPPAEILLIDADEDSISQYFLREQGDRIRLLEFSDALSGIKAQVRADAVRRGILLKAEENARQLIRNFLTLQGFRDVQFTTSGTAAEPAEAQETS